MTPEERTIIIGKNSAVWRDLAKDPQLSHCIAIGHGDVAGFNFEPMDTVWILSYSRRLEENRILFETLAGSTAKRFVYVSTAVANIDEVTSCYEYPRVKRECERLSQSLLDAVIVAIGVVYGSEEDLPAGTTMATSHSDLARSILGIRADAQTYLRLFRPVSRPFRTGIEATAFRFYGVMQRMTLSWPCLLRPIDLLLRAASCRWYGYLYLSNRLWLTTTS